MAMFAWDDKLKTNHPSIDIDHKKLVDLVNQLADAMQAGKGKDVCGAVLNNLISYTKTHFAMEERLMSQHGYANSAAHKAEHQKLLADVADFKTKFDAGSLTLTASLLAFLRDWLIKHISHSDKALANAIAARGVAA